MHEAAQFKDQVVLITGAGRGIGRAIAQAFAAQGAIVAANDITPVNLDETLALIQAGRGRVKDYIYDVAKRMPIQALVSQVLEDWRQIDVLVNNAAVQPHASILEMDEWEWCRTLDVNLSGPFFTMQLVGKHMRERGSGAIVNLACAVHATLGAVDRAAVIASKTGLIGLTRAAALEFAPYHIRVNAVCPGGSGAANAQQVAKAVLFLSSLAADGLTGQVMDVEARQVQS